MRRPAESIRTVCPVSDRCPPRATWLVRSSKAKGFEDDAGQEASLLLWPGRNQDNAQRKAKAVKAALYAVQVFYSFFIMRVPPRSVQKAWALGSWLLTTLQASVHDL